MTIMLRGAISFVLVVITIDCVLLATGDFISLSGSLTSQSSISHNGYSALAVDGNETTDYREGSCTHTSKDATTSENWWQVDLGEIYDVTSVYIVNRGDKPRDCCAERLANFKIELSDNADASGAVQCAAQVEAMTAGQKKTFQCVSPTRGRYLRISKPTTTSLTLCEVKVTGTRGDFISLSGSRTSQSSIHNNGISARAVDGNEDTYYPAKSCTHTKKATTGENPGENWWQVDLGGIYEVTSVYIVNRGDCCAERLANFKIELSDNAEAIGAVQCAAQKEAMTAGQKKTFPCVSSTRGRYLRISIPGTTFLTLCEVKVTGTLSTLMSCTYVRQLGIRQTTDISQWLLAADTVDECEEKCKAKGENCSGATFIWQPRCHLHNEERNLHNCPLWKGNCAYVKKTCAADGACTYEMESGKEQKGKIYRRLPVESVGDCEGKCKDEGDKCTGATFLGQPRCLLHSAEGELSGCSWWNDKCTYVGKTCPGK